MRVNIPYDGHGIDSTHAHTGQTNDELKHQQFMTDLNLYLIDGQYIFSWIIGYGVGHTKISAGEGGMGFDICDNTDE